MAAVTRKQIEAELPAEALRRALDDDFDGIEDGELFDAIVENAEILCKGRLGSAAALLPSEVDKLPAAYTGAVLLQACVALLRRGNAGSDAISSWQERLDAALGILDKIAKGEISLIPKASGSFGPSVKAGRLLFEREEGL